MRIIVPIAKQEGYKQVINAGDSKHCMDALTKLNHEPGWEIAPNIEDIKELKSEFELCTFSGQEELQTVQLMSLQSGQFCQTLLVFYLYLACL